MELRHLRYFVAVAEQRSFSRAAERLRVAQPALSKQIRQLEDEIGVLLFQRESRPLRLTEAGALFLDRAQAVLNSVHVAAIDARRIEKGQSGHLSVGYVGSSMYTVLPAAVNRFRERHPGVEIALHELTAAQIVRALTDRRIDIGLSRPPLGDDETFAQRILLDEPYVAALPERHKLAKRQSISLRELAADGFILHPRFPGPSVTDTVMEACAALGFEPREVQQASHMQTIIGLVASGLGVSLVPASVGRQPWSGVAYVALKAPAPSAPLAIVWRKGKLSAVLQNFIDTIDETATRVVAADAARAEVIAGLLAPKPLVAAAKPASSPSKDK